MHGKIHLAWSAVLVALLIGLGSGFAAPQIEQSPMTPYMRSAVGTPDELSPLAPVGGQNVRKVGNQWACEQNGRTMIYNDAASCWQPK